MSSPLSPSTSPASISDPGYYTAAMSYAEWKREPTTTQVLFGLQLPYRPPRSFLGQFLWRRRVWVEVTFALSMLEPWEKLLVMVIMYLALGTVLTGIFLYLPEQLVRINERVAYYLFGGDASGAGAASDISDSLYRLKAAASWGASLAGWRSDASSEL